MMRILNQHEIQMISAGNLLIGRLADILEYRHPLKIIVCAALMGAIECGFYGLQKPTMVDEKLDVKVISPIESALNGALRYGLAAFIGLNIRSWRQSFSGSQS